MKEIKLTQGLVALVDDEDFEYLSQWKWYASKVKNLYYYAKRNDYESGVMKNIKMHRQILSLTDSNKEVDHIDHNSLNNQRVNLRIATRSQNTSNVFSKEKSSSKYKGVSFDKRDMVWQVNITKNRITKYLGRFDNEIEAALAYNKAAKEIHGEFACLNEV